MVLVLSLGLLIAPVDAGERPTSSECNLYSDSAPEGCLCLDEDKVIDAVSELKACRKMKNAPAMDMGWAERLAWLITAIAGALLL